MTDTPSSGAGRGFFITFEGGEGAGKSTQCRRLARAFTSAGVKVLVTREPGGTSGAEAIRSLLTTGALDRWSPKSETILHYAARREHLDRMVMPALARGEAVISDRFADSTMAYQGYGSGVDREWIEALHRLVVERDPDLTLVLNVPLSEGFGRLKSRAEVRDRYEQMDLDFHRRVHQGFLAIAEQHPKRCAVVDGQGDVDAVHHRIVSTVNDRLGLAIKADDGPET